ncbi:MAG: TonB-dependent receptor plug domain-containing protein [Ignavibacteria bacterium]
MKKTTLIILMIFCSAYVHSQTVSAIGKSSLQKDIKFVITPATAELLSNTGNVLVQKRQLGGGSPIIRGFEVNKVLIMIDGVRLNNIIFRGGHLQNILRVDENILSRSEIPYGAGTTIDGSDALRL